MAGKFELTAAKNGKFRFNLKAGNGQIILTSQIYDSKAGAEKGIESVKTNAPEDGRYERLTSNNGQPYFTLRAGNGQVIGTSEMYSSVPAMENGITSVKTHAPGAVVVETVSK